MKRFDGKCIGLVLVVFGAAVFLSSILPPKILVFIMTVIIIFVGISLLRSC